MTRASTVAAVAAVFWLGSVGPAPALARAAAAPAASASPGSATPATSPPPGTSPAPGASPAAGPDPVRLANARAEFEAWLNGKIDLSHYIPEAAGLFTPAAVSQLSTQYLKPIGTLKTFTQVRVVTTQGVDVYVYRAVGDKGPIDEAISWNAAGKVQYIRFIPVP